MPWLNPKAPYNAILSHIKERGVRVYHRDLKEEAGGLFDCRKSIITIHKDYRETWDGCYFAAHEWAHWCDYREGKFLNFFETNLEFTQENLNLIIEAEMSAVNGAVKFLKMWGIKYEPRELTEKGYKECLEFWQNRYFPKKSSKK